MSVRFSLSFKLIPAMSNPLFSLGCDVEEFEDLFETGQDNYDRYESDNIQGSDAQAAGSDSSHNDDKSSSSSLSVPSSSFKSSTSSSSLSSQKKGNDSGSDDAQWEPFEAAP